MGWVGRLSLSASLLRAPYGANNFQNNFRQVSDIDDTFFYGFCGFF